MYDFKFADIGEGIHEGQILKWNYKVGDKVKEGSTICVVETDKVNAEIPAPVSGVVVKLGAEVGKTIYVGETLMLIDDGSAPSKEEKEAPKLEKTEEAGAGVVGEIEVSSDVIESSSESNQKSESSDYRVLATPVARKLAGDLNLDIKKIKGTGEQGRVLKEDIELAGRQQQQQQIKVEQPKEFVPEVIKMPQFSNDGTRRVPISKLRKTIAKNMVISKQLIPDTTVMDEFIITDLVQFRNAQKPLAESKQVKLTYMAFFIKAVTITLKEFPIFNSSFDHEKEEIIYKDFINVGIAVDTPEGLIVPNIKNADRLSIFEIATELESLAKQALDRTIQLNQLQQGTFSITNYGVFNSTYGTPIIKHPEVAILGIGKIMKKPVVVNDQIVIGDVVPLSLTIDHRIIDGGDAGRFMMRLRELITNPMLLLLN
jgi:pyruvate dehydrogenase E2 component (dihydrolipoamide acetyltransferase)